MTFTLDAATLSILSILGSGLVLHHLLVTRPRERLARTTLQKTKERRLKPLARHPQIDLTMCLGCGTCVDACPETHGADSPLAVIDVQAVLVNPLRCVGHGDCEAACPVGAIVVGLGVLANDPTIPRLTEENESTVPGVYIAGELSGVPLIKNALAHGAQVIDAIAEEREAEGPADPRVLDVAIVGLGPAGLSAALHAEERGLRYVAIDQGKLGGTVANYPRKKLVLTEPIELPFYGRFKKSEVQKEELIEVWHEAAEKAGLATRLQEKVLAVEQTRYGFRIRTSKGKVRARRVVLAIGRRGSPRRLGVPGEDRPKVAYGVDDPEAYDGEDLLVVGGGDSAVEAALALARKNRVTLSYRKEEFFRAKSKNQKKIATAAAGGEVNVVFCSQTTQIREREVTLRQGDEELVLPNDRVFVLIGGEPPFPFLRAVGVLPPEKKSLAARRPVRVRVDAPLKSHPGRESAP